MTYQQPGMPPGWTIRERYPFYDGPEIEFVLAHKDGASHNYVLDRAFFAPGGPGFGFVHAWMQAIINPPLEVEIS